MLRSGGLILVVLAAFSLIWESRCSALSGAPKPWPSPLRGQLRRLLVPLAILFALAMVGAGPAWAVGVPVVIDGFGNARLAASPFTRAVTALPLPDTSTTPQGTFSASGGVATMTMSGSGNGESGTTLTYTPTAGGSVDLTGGGTDDQILVDFALVDQVPAAGQFADGVDVYLNATDSSGAQAIAPLDSVGNYYAFNAAFPFTDFGCENEQCTNDGGENWTKITSLSVTFEYPGSGSGGGSLSVEVNELWATPAGGAPPSAPSPTVTAPATSTGGPGATVDFTVAFTDDQGAAPVTYDPPSNTGVRAQDLSVSGSAFGAATPSVIVTGGPSTYTVAVKGMTQTGAITVHVPAGIVDDAWSQLNVASSDDPTVAFTYAIKPDFASASATTFTVSTLGSFTVNATGGSPAPTPTPALSLSAGTLPSGLTFTDNGNGTASISGTPKLGTVGVTDLTLRATNAGGTVTQRFTLTVAKAAQAALSLTSTSGAYGTPLTLTTGGGSGTGAVTYAVTNGTAAGCALAAGALSATSAGTCLVTATKAADANYNTVSSAQTTVTLGADTPTLSLSGNPVSGDNTYDVTLTVPSGGVAPSESVTVTDSSTASCTIGSLTGSGTSYTGSCAIDSEAAGVTVTATYASGDANYTSVPSNTLTVAKAAQAALPLIQAALTLTSTSGKYGTPLTLTTGGGSGTGAVTYAVTNGTAAGCALAAGALSATSAGTCLVTATKAADANYNAVSSAQTTVTFAQISQTIAFTPLARRTLAQPPVTVKATASSGLTVTFSTTTPGVCTSAGTNGAKITFRKAGTCVVEASQIGNADYSAAPRISDRITVSKAGQTITFKPLANRRLSQSPVTVHATASSRLTVTFTTITPVVCTSRGTNGLKITLLKAGTCVVVAHQRGNATYSAARTVSRHFTVTEQ